MQEYRLKNDALLIYASTNRRTINRAGSVLTEKSALQVDYKPCDLRCLGMAGLFLYVLASKELMRFVLDGMTLTPILNKNH